MVFLMPGDIAGQRGAHMRRAAELSDCGTWRFTLTRAWGPAPAVVFVLLNPSRADADRDDPTLRRCIGLARAAGAGGLCVVNLFALRTPDPRALARAPDAVGPGNDAAVLRAARAGQVICGWGNGGARRGRGAAVAALLRGAGVALWHLGLTATGAPRHPLYLPSDTRPQAWA